MTKPYLAFHPDPRKPAYRPPADACDAHCHVFGPAAVFPFAAERTYTPVDAPKELLFALHDHLGFSRSVIVQASCHGRDNSAMLDAIAASDGRYRGVAMVDPTVEPAELKRLDAGGIRGARINFVKHLGGGRQDAARQLAPKLADLGWHLVVHFDADQAEDLAPFFRSLPVTIVIDHMGRPDASEGVDQPAFQSVLRMVDDEKVWIKVSGADRITRQGPPYDDAVPFARALVERAPDRVLWGTDWAHPNARPPMPDDGELVDLIPLMAPGAEAQRKLLVDNPTRLYWQG